MDALIKQISWIWRLIATALCYIFFGLGGIFLSLFWFNLLLLIVWDKNKRTKIARYSISYSFRAFLKIAKFIGVLDYHVIGAEILNNDKGCIIAANHPTLIDYVLIASVMPEVDCLVKRELLRNIFVRGVIKSADYLINDQGPSLLAESNIRLGRGDSVLIFPEGTRTRPNENMRLQRGTANIAVRCQKDIRAVHIYCSENVLGKKSPWYNIPRNRPAFEVFVKNKIDIKQLDIVDTKEPSIAARHLNELLLKNLNIDETKLLGNENASTLC